MAKQKQTWKHISIPETMKTQIAKLAKDLLISEAQVVIVAVEYLIVKLEEEGGTL